MFSNNFNERIHCSHLLCIALINLLATYEIVYIYCIRLIGNGRRKNCLKKPSLLLVDVSGIVDKFNYPVMCNTHWSCSFPHINNYVPNQNNRVINNKYLQITVIRCWFLINLIQSQIRSTIEVLSVLVTSVYLSEND